MQGWKVKAVRVVRLGIAALGLTTLGWGAAQVVGGAIAADAKQGERAFRRLCSACHAPTPGVTRLGPSLYGVIGRESGAMPGFAYSPAYAEGRVVWTPDVLEEYLKDPKAYMPGSRMNFAGIRSEVERADVVAYLETLR